MLGLGFKKSQSESTLYIRKINTGILIISLYVDDLLVTGNNQCLMDKFKVEMEVFEMTDLGDMSYFIGMEVIRISTRYSSVNRSMQRKF